MTEDRGFTVADATLGFGGNHADQLDQHAHFDLMSRVAVMYYLEDRTQAEIGKELALSRQKVQRLLRQAREQRIVEIHVHAVPVLHMELERRIRDIFGLEMVVVAPTDPDPERRRQSVARAAASYLGRLLKDGMVVAVGLGRNTGTVADFLHIPQRVESVFVSAMGGSPSMGAFINPNEVCTRLARQAGGRAFPLYAPAYVESESVRDMLYAQETVQQGLSMARQADMALMGVGTAEDASILVQTGCLSPEEALRLQVAGAVGELIGNYFDEQGQHVHSSVDGRLIGLTVADLRRISRVIAVASEKGKARAVVGALRTGSINVLITECENALAILQLAGVADLAEEQSFLETSQAAHYHSLS